MNQPISLEGREFFDDVTHQGKRIKVGDEVLVPQAGQTRRVTVSGISKSQGHYWVGYEENRKFCPWPLARLAE